MRICLLILALSIAVVRGEHLYVSASGAGDANGSDWSNAFAGFGDVSWGTGAGQLGAGDTLWIAGGTYTTQLELKASGTAENRLWIKRATTNDTECTSAAGWTLAMDGQVLITANNGIMISSSTAPPNGPGRFVTVDGRSKDGIRIDVADVSGGKGVLIEGYGEYNSVFRYIGSYGASTDPTEEYVDFDHRSLEVRNYDGGTGGSEPTRGFLFEYMTLSGTPTALFVNQSRNITNQFCDIHTVTAITGNEDVHANLAYIMAGSHNGVFRWNTVHDTGAGVGVFFTYFGGGEPTTNWAIYGNVFRDSNMEPERAITVREGADGTGPLYIYNNTFVNFYTGISVECTNLNPDAESYIYNNLFVAMGAGGAIALPGGEDSVSADYNLITNSYALFLDAGETNVLESPYEWQWVRDLRLVEGCAAIGAGTNLGSAFGTDIRGLTRGDTWDIGAYEFAEGEEPEPEPEDPPAVVPGSASAVRVNVGRLIRR